MIRASGAGGIIRHRLRIPRGVVAGATGGAFHRVYEAGKYTRNGWRHVGSLVYFGRDEFACFA